ncbi:restriction endonuclease [Leptolyngbya sp. NIES-2104]|uniref:restriction endonuclease n=1 Tax=Leptolyngbya sp. NIES-2104 TaxID=1552121 RepID=UPI0006EC6497|nr:restriction endonuclease [Leptolyngbya sp. NIES-2104]GAP98377.1 putative restriction endonuclease [Leptolyngbya sp. NIES-2104]
MSEIWFVRAGRESVYAEEFIQKKIVAIGSPDLGKVDESVTKADLILLYEQAYSTQSVGTVQANVSQILRFMREVKVGDAVMTHDRNKQMYYIGVITSEYQWKPEIIAELPRIREVEWKYQIPRTSLSSDTKNSLGAIQTLFLIKGKPTTEIQSKQQAIQQAPFASPVLSQTQDQNDLEREIRAELLEKSEQAIEDRIVRLQWEQVQELSAGILRAMGYRTTVSPRGSDRGVDVFASPDGLGLEEPRIFVEVKHRPNTSMTSQDIRSFIGGRSAGDRCLYVSTGGYTKDARYEADRSSIPITLLGIVELRRLFVDYYEKLDEEVKSLIPLKRIHVLAD